MIKQEKPIITQHERGKQRQVLKTDRNRPGTDATENIDKRTMIKER